MGCPATRRRAPWHQSGCRTSSVFLAIPCWCRVGGLHTVTPSPTSFAHQKKAGGFGRALSMARSRLIPLCSPCRIGSAGEVMRTSACPHLVVMTAGSARAAFRRRPGGRLLVLLGLLAPSLALSFSATDNDELPSTPSKDKGPPPYAQGFESLPPGWERAVCPQTGRIYYIDHVSRRTSWQLPAMSATAEAAHALSLAPRSTQSSFVQRRRRRLQTNGNVDFIIFQDFIHVCEDFGLGHVFHQPRSFGTPDPPSS